VESAATGERSFDEWVCFRLREWSTTQILDFVRWLDDHDGVEYVPAVREALVRRGAEFEGADVPAA
jgi:hypothetical protein